MLLYSIHTHCHYYCTYIAQHFKWRLLQDYVIDNKNFYSKIPHCNFKSIYSHILIKLNSSINMLKNYYLAMKGWINNISKPIKIIFQIVGSAYTAGQTKNSSPKILRLNLYARSICIPKSMGFFKSFLKIYFAQEIFQPFDEAHLTTNLMAEIHFWR